MAGRADGGSGIPVLITGAGGFAGRHLASLCAAAGDDVVGVARSTPDRLDLLQARAVQAMMAAVQPSVVYHLAARAHVGASWREPGATLSENVAMTLNVLEAVRCEAPGAIVVLASSGEVYGTPDELPVDESALLRPQNPYAVSKAGSDLLGGLYADAHGLTVVRARAFNHAGPGQPSLYAIASFSRQVAEGLEAGSRSISVVTGNADTRRDYTDVRDVARAYRMLAAHAKPGVYNVCSGQPASAGELVSALARITGARIEHVVDPAVVRSHEVLEISGSPGKLHRSTGWEPEVPLERTLADTVAWWRTELRAGRAPSPRHE